jgi:hypothetical protein
MRTKAEETQESASESEDNDETATAAAAWPRWGRRGSDRQTNSPKVDIVGGGDTYPNLLILMLKNCNLYICGLRPSF